MSYCPECREQVGDLDDFCPCGRWARSKAYRPLLINPGDKPKRSTWRPRSRRSRWRRLVSKISS